MQYSELSESWNNNYSLNLSSYDKNDYNFSELTSKKKYNFDKLVNLLIDEKLRNLHNNYNFNDNILGMSLHKFLILFLAIFVTIIFLIIIICKLIK